MVLELAIFEVTPGQETAFTTAVQQGKKLLTETPGCRSLRFTRGVESPSRFVLLVEWDSVEAHERNFRAGPDFGRWRELVSPYFAGPPVVEHYSDVD